MAHAIEKDSGAGRCDVFLSYAHEDDADLGCASELAAALKSDGFSVWWDRELRGGDDWHEVITERMQASSLVVALWSKKALSRPMCRYESMYASGAGKLFPVVIEELEPSDFPDELRGLTYRLHRVEFDPSSLVAQIRAQVSASHAASTRASAALLANERVDLPAALTSGSGFLVGREQEEAMLLDAWTSCGPHADPKSKVHIVVLHALGGAGKTTLIRRLIDRLAEHGFPHAEKVLGWSAYSQGSGENRIGESDTFMANALDFMGHRGELPRDPIARARLLVARMRDSRTLLLLDGIEPLQSLPEVDNGRLKDRGLQRLLQDLAVQGHPGLVVITSRQDLPELRGHTASKVRSHALERLSAKAGTDLLRHLGCRGKPAEFEQAVKDAQGHALTITLLGTYISSVEDGDIARRDQLRLADVHLTAEELEASDHTVRLAKRSAAIMKGYIARFEELSQKSRGRGEAERLVLSIVALFNRPADGSAVRALLEGRPIHGLTETYGSWSPQAKAQRLRIAKLRLRELKLLAEADPNDIDGLDAHPVVRSYFAHAQLESNSRGYHEAQEFLGTHYANLARKIPHYDVSRDDRKDAERIHHLAMAVYHKCRKGQAEDAFVNIYWEEIQAERRYYLTTERHLGAYALSILANFFAEPWHKLRPVGELIGVRILNEAAFCLRGIGRLDEAVQASETALDAAIRLKRHSEYFNAGVNLVNILIVLGRLDQALTLARKLKATYEHLGTGWVNAVVRVRVLATLADCLYQMGKTKKAKTAIANAMKISAQQSPVPMTIANRVSLQIYAGGGNLNEGVARARADLDRLRQERQSDLVAIAFCEMLLAMGLARAGSVAEATSLFDTSVLKFRSSARDDILPYGLLARAAHRRLAFKRSGDAALVHAAGEDLTEVEEIAERGGMRLHLTDFHLECARLHCAQIARGEPVWLPVHLEAQAPGAPRKPSFWASLFGSRHVAQPALEAKPSRLTPRQQDCLRAAEKHLQAGSRLIDDTHYLRREEERAELRKELDRLRGTG